MTTISKLLSYLHPGFDRDPEAQLVLRIQKTGGLTWSVADGTLTIITVTPAQTITANLSQYTLGALHDYLVMRGVDVVYYDSSLADRSALIMIDGAGDQDESNGDHLYVYQSLLWAHLGAYGQELTLIRAAIALLPDQMRLPASRGEWLDFLGEWYGSARLAGEVDDDYAVRMLADIIKPKCNNIAIQDALATKFGLGLTQVQVVDAALTAYSPVPPSGHTHHYAEFDVVLTPPYGNIDIFDMPPFVKPLRVAGTRLRRIVTSLFDQIPKTAVRVHDGVYTTIYPYQIDLLSVQSQMYGAAVFHDADVITIYPYTP